MASVTKGRTAEYYLPLEVSKIQCACKTEAMAPLSETRDRDKPSSRFGVLV